MLLQQSLFLKCFMNSNELRELEHTKLYCCLEVLYDDKKGNYSYKLDHLFCRLLRGKGHLLGERIYVLKWTWRRKETEISIRIEVAVCGNVVKLLKRF